MTTETENASTPDPKDQAAAEAAFNASFEDKEAPPAQPATGATESEKNTEGAKAGTTAAAEGASGAPAATSQAQPTAQAATAGAQEAASTTPTPKPDEVAELRAELRRVHGRFGALHDELKQLKTTKEAEGKPAAATPLELSRLKAEYPELADVLTEDLAKALGGLAAKSSDPKEIDELVTQRVHDGVAREAATLRDAAVTDAHPNWKQDLFTKDPVTGQKAPTADYLAWKQSLGTDEANAFETSDNPYHVIRKLNGFYEWKNKAGEAEKAKQQRLKDNVTPQGVPRAGPQTLSDREAEAKGFLEGFNS